MDFIQRGKQQAEDFSVLQILEDRDKALKKQSISIMALPGVPIIEHEDDVADAILKALETSNIQLLDEDLVIIAHTIVSKSEGRVVHVDEVLISGRAREIADQNGFDPVQVELALRECNEVIRSDGALITETKTGLVCNFSGVDRSNAPKDSYVLLPEDPDRSARDILRKLANATGVRLGIIITDTQGRPWRKGSVNLAIGSAGINAFKHNRGMQDLYGRPIKRSTVCQVDELAASAEPIMGQADEGVPIVIIRGYEYEDGSERSRDVPRPKSEDLFR